MTSLRHVRFFLTLCLSLAIPSVSATELRVAVASNFARTAQQLSAMFTEASGYRVSLSAGSTGKLYAQIINGAPFDVLLAADTLRPEKLEASGAALAGSRFTYARGVLVAWSSDADLIDSNAGLPEIGFLRRIAIANPQLAPYGQAAEQTLRALSLWAEAEPKLVRGESIGQTYQFVATGNAELGFIARSQLSSDTGSYWVVPGSLYQPVDQQLVVLNGADAALAFANFLRSAAAQDVILASGYLLPED
ncbi:MAG: molybdate ABC transporter substrate-binding protein [Gammaproteobacteria bacterium]|nr:molybdate ABC transporter substrate-binding protein [Gammaproteobacteria bacterium]